MSELFETVDANRAAAEERQRAEAQAAEAALAEWQEQQERRRIRRRKRATRSLVLRTLFVVAVQVLLALAMFEGLMDARLAVALGAFASCWLCVWIGAWLQFMYADGGLLNVVK